MSRGRLYLVRHGESMGNAWKEAYRDDRRNFLSPYGVMQAQLTGHFFKKIGAEFSEVYSSDLTRARHTMAVILHEVGWQRNWRNEEVFNELSRDEDPRGEQARKRLKEIIDSWTEKDLLVVSHYHTMQALFGGLVSDRNLIDSHGGRHVGNASPFVWDPNVPDRIHLLDLTKTGTQF